MKTACFQSGLNYNNKKKALTFVRAFSNILIKELI